MSTHEKQSPISRWREHLSVVAPTAWEVTQALPFTIAAAGQALVWECIASSTDGDDLVEEYQSGSWLLSARYTRSTKARSWVVQLEICSDQDSAPLTLIEPMRLVWSAPAGTEPSYVRTVAGGVNEKVYPPHAFRSDTLRMDPAGFCWIENGWDGRSSDKHMPMLTGAVGDDAFICTLEWSGYWWGSIGRSGGEGREYTLQIKVPVKGIHLASGEKLPLPAAHYVFCTGGLDGATNAFRRYLNDAVLPSLDGKRMMPTISFNHWFGLGADISEDLMMRLVPMAARAGCEYFIQDAGWYAGCRGNDFEPGVGNLEMVDAAKFPRGLKPLAQCIRAAGMEMGLWFEVERAHRSSDWVKRHPEWFIDIGGEYLHIDLSIRAAQDGCIVLITSMVRDLGLKWLRFDHNMGPKPFWDHKDPTGKIQFTYLHGLYRVLDECICQCPDVIMECCASGGRRLDLAILRRAHEAWISDETFSSENVRAMQAGASYLLPGQLNNSGIPFGRTEGSTTFTDYDVVCRMLGSLSFCGDLTVLEGDDLDRLGRLSKMYRTVRQLLSESFYPLLPQPSTDSHWQAVQFCEPDGAEAVIFVFSGAEPLEEPHPIIRAKALDPVATYTVRRIDGTTSQKMSGADLMRTGVQLNLNPKQCAIWHLVR